MSAQQLAHFIARFNEDPELRDAVTAIDKSTPELLASAIAEIARAQGFEVTIDECLAYGRAYLGSANVRSRELSEADLDAVSGGTVYTYSLGSYFGSGGPVSVMPLPPPQPGVMPVPPPQPGGCFLTTACCRARGLGDDCKELEAFRALRDGYVLGLPEGPAIVADYYRHAPLIVSAIESRMDAHRCWGALFDTMVRPNVRRLQSGWRREAFEDSMRIYRSLKRHYLDRA